MRLAFIITILLTGSTVVAQVINRAEYFIDADPGNGNGTVIAVTSPSASVNFLFTVPTTSLTSGFHILGFRSRESGTGFWSHATYSTFYIVATPPSQNATNITKAEYFFDVDPGNGFGVNVPISTSASITTAFNTPTTALSPGFHTLHFRTKDDRDKWSIAHIQTFYIVPPPPSSPSNNLVKAEYFFDADPGQGNGVTLTIAASSTHNNSFPIPITGLTEGFHRLNVRYKDNANTWSIAHQQIFYVLPQNSLPATNVTRVEYYVDTDPGYGQATAATITTGPNVDLTPMTVNTTGVPSGNHVLYVRARDDKGFWSDVVSGPFSISNCIPPSQPVVNDQSRCGVGTISFTATGATGAQEYRWYEDVFATATVATGSPFQTPSLNTTKNYYVSIYDPATTCESARRLAIATVTIIAKPTLNLNGDISFCEGNSIFLRAPSGFSNYLWSNGSTSQQILATTAGDYFVKTGNVSGCLSENSDTVSVDVIPAPAKPTIAVTGGDLCSVGSVVLSGPTGFEYIWSTGVTTQDVTISQAGTFTLSIRNANGCQSAPSDPIVLSAGQAQAFITLVGNTLVTVPGDAYQWFRNGVVVTGATQQTFEINALDFAIYSVQVTTNGCSSTSDDFIYLITDVEQNKSAFRVYPNPASETLFVELSESINEIRIIDSTGKSWHESEAPKGLHTVNVSELPQGTYYLRIKSHDDVIVFKLQKL
jgi:hypothetical protein